MRCCRFGVITFGALVATLLPLAVPQQLPDPDTRTREYIRFLITELDQWTRDLPKAYNMALVRPPVDASQLNDAQKAAADNLRAAIVKISAASQATDIAKNKQVHADVEAAMAAADPLNTALGAARFPEGLENQWAQIRMTLNSLADIYQVQELAIIDPPAPGSGKTAVAAAAIPPGSIVAYVVDQRCALRGKAMWTNAQCVQTCVRDGDKVVLVTEEGKVIQVANQEKIEAETYGQKVAVTGKMDADIITVASTRIL